MHATAAKRDIKITGSGSTNGGQFRHVRTMGDAMITGSIHSDSMRSMGTLGISGDLRTGHYRQIGETSVQGDLAAEELQILGQAQIQGHLRSRVLRLRGQLDVGGNCETHRFDARGGFVIQGALHAGEIDVRTWGPCRAKEVSGARVVIRRSKWGGLKQIFADKDPMTMTAERIEGEYIYLEHTTADVVRGDNVTIGSGCRIGRVEYRKQLRRLGDAQINQETKLPG